MTDDDSDLVQRHVAEGLPLPPGEYHVTRTLVAGSEHADLAEALDLVEALTCVLSWSVPEEEKDELRDRAGRLLARYRRTCGDCGAQPGEPHMDGCDMGRCTECGDQRITCDHGESPIGWGQIWSGQA